MGRRGANAARQAALLVAAEAEEHRARAQKCECGEEEPVEPLGRGPRRGRDSGRLSTAPKFDVRSAARHPGSGWRLRQQLLQLLQLRRRQLLRLLRGGRTSSCGGAALNSGAAPPTTPSSAAGLAASPSPAASAANTASTGTPLTGGGGGGGGAAAAPAARLPTAGALSPPGTPAPYAS